MKIFIILIICAFYSNSLLAQPGTLDSSFNGDGKVIISSPNIVAVAHSVILQPDNKILIGGISGDDMVLIRLDIDGSIDNTFGIVTTDFSGIDRCYSMILQPDSKIVLAGFTEGVDSNKNFAIARYHSNGALDLTYGNNGKVVTDFGTQSDQIFAIELQPDLKLIAAGQTQNDIAIARYNVDGSLDNTFNLNGKITTDFNSSNEHASGVSFLSDSTILIVGSGGGDIIIAKYNQNGSLDTSFNNNGKVIHTFTNNEYISSSKVQPDGKILVAGSSGALMDFFITRFNDDGTLDQSFGVNGIVYTDFGGLDNLTAIDIQPDDKIIVAGASYAYMGDLSFSFAHARYNFNGTLDSTFNNTGKVISKFSGIDAIATTIAIQPDGKIILAGGTVSLDRDIVVARYLSGLNIGVPTFNTISSNIIYPNPIENEAVLEYYLEKNERLSINLYDINGRLVRTYMSNEERNTGQNREVLHFNDDIPSGNYILSLSNGVGEVNIKVIKK